jgi:hypothetical protein
MRKGPGHRSGLGDGEPTFSAARGRTALAGAPPSSSYATKKRGRSVIARLGVTVAEVLVKIYR